MNQDFSDSPSRLGRSQDVTEADYHRLLSDERRRVAFNILETRKTPIELMELATAIATQEVDADVPETEYVERVATALHHNHLPKMDQLGVIDYDTGSKRITINE